MFLCCFGKSTAASTGASTAASATHIPDWKSTVPFVPPVNGGHVIKVYDGDTITIASKLPFTNHHKDTMWRFSVRLNGIDCPEIKGKSESEKNVAQIAKKTLSDLILNKKVELKDVQLEKYGRLLATVVYNKRNINDWMVEQRLAVKYDGGTKECPDDWEIYYGRTDTVKI